jgi:hypothetical protein
VAGVELELGLLGDLWPATKEKVVGAAVRWCGSGTASAVGGTRTVGQAGGGGGTHTEEDDRGCTEEEDQSRLLT